MNRWHWIFVIAIATVLGCSSSRRGGQWNVGFPDFGETIGDFVRGGDSDYDRSRRFWDQTSDNPRR